MVLKWYYISIYMIISTRILQCFRCNNIIFYLFWKLVFSAKYRRQRRVRRYDKKNECVLRVMRVRVTHTATLLSYIHFTLHYIIYIFLDKTRPPSHHHMHSRFIKFMSIIIIFYRVKYFHRVNHRIYNRIVIQYDLFQIQLRKRH